MSGNITEDTVWGPQGSPYILQSSVQVRDDISLTILPGTVVKAAANTEIGVDGQLLVVGEPGNRVTFTSMKDDSVGGDTNGDGASSTPSAGDWLGIRIQPSSDDTTIPMSVIDYANIRYGGAGDISALGCTGRGGLSASYGARVVLSNSKVTDSQVNSVSVSSSRDRQYVGLFNNEFSGGECGVSIISATGDVVGNKISSDFSNVGVGVLGSQDVRFWFNEIESDFYANASPAPTRSEVDFRYNTLTGTRAIFGAGSQQLMDYSLNWWGRDFTSEPFPTDCLTLAEASGHSPPLTTVFDLTCPPERRYRPTGFGAEVLPALTENPGEMPLALAESQVPTFGPVDTLNGKVQYSATDMVVQDAGKQIEVSRTFDPDLTSGDLGEAWRSSYSEETSQGLGPMMLTLADGASVPFPTDLNSTQTPTRGVTASGSSLNGISTVTTPDRTTMTFDGAGGMTSMSLGDSEHRLDIDRSGGKVAKITGVSGRFVDYDRSDGKLREVSDSQGRSVTYGYDGDGRLDQVTGVDGKTTQYEYAGSKLRKVTTAAGVVELEVGYDGQDRVAWVKEQGSGRADITYNSDATRTITLATGTTIRQKVDDAGRLVSERTGDRSSRHVVYDGEGRVVSEITGIPTEPTLGYGPVSSATIFDKRGNPRIQVDGMGRGTTTRFNSDHLPTKVVDSFANATTYEYDSNQRLTSMVDSRGEWEFENNGRGQRTKTIDPAGREVTATYNSKGDRISDTNEYGGVTTYDVDARGQVTSSTDSLNRQTSFEYTSWGQLKRYELPRGGAYAATFDDDRRVTAVSEPRGGSTLYGYDPAGRLATITDAAGEQTTLSYDASGRLERVEDPRGAETTQEYTADGLVASTTNAEGETTINAYDPAGRLLRVTDPLGRTTQTVFDRSGKQVKVMTPDGATRTTSYDANGYPAKTIAGDGGEWTSVYDPTGNITKLTDPLGKVTSWTYDAAGRVATATDPRGTTTTYAYSNGGRTRTATDPLGLVESATVDLAGQTTETVDARGHETTVVYNADGLIASQTAPGNVTSGYGYDLAGNRTSQTNPAGGITTATYDPLGRIATKTHPDGSDEEFTYDPVGNLTRHTDRRGNDWTYEFDDANRVVTATNPLDAATTYQYDDAGQQTRVTDPSGVWTETAYDPVGRPAVVTDATEASTVYIYDHEGRTTKVTDPSGVAVTTTFNKRGEPTRLENAGASLAQTFTYDNSGNRLTQTRSAQTYTWTYDARGRVASSTDARGNTTTHTHDLAGNRTSAQYPDGNVDSWSYDAAGRLKFAARGPAIDSRYEYDAAGNVTEIELPGGGAFDFEYDNQGRMTSQTDPEGLRTEYDWNPAGQLVATAKPSGLTISSTFDAAGRETERSAGTMTREFAYDPAGRMTEASDSTRTLTFGYDARGLLDKYTDEAGTTAYTRNSAGRLTGVTAATGASTTFGYNNQGLMSTMRGTVNLNFGYNGYGQLTSRSNVSPTRNAATSYAYDLDGNTTSLTFASRLSYTASYDQMGRATTVTKDLTGVTNPLEGTNTYSYDDTGRLESWELNDGTTTTSTTYDWDPDSNRISETSGTDPPITSTFDDAGRRVADSDGTTYDYDDDGNLVGIDRATGDDLTLTYNAFGELSGATSGSTNVDYELDPLGRTASRDDGTTSTDFGYDAVSGELASAKTGTTVTELLRDASGQAITAKTGTTLNHLGLDLHGDVAASTTNTVATLGSSAIYDPFGTATTTGTAVSPLGYQGDRTDPTTGLVDMGARNYLPETGAFTSPDTVIGDLTSAVTLNRYTYAWGDPINMFDPDGHWPSWSSAKNAVSGAINAAKNVVKSAINWVADNVIKPAANAVRSAGNWVANTTRSAASRVASAVAQARTVSIKATKAAKAEIQKISRQVTAAAARMDTAVASGGPAASFTNSIARAVSRIDTSSAHTALALAGLIPVVGEFADGADAILYLIEGDTGNALLSAAAMLPVGGHAAGLAKLGRLGDGISPTLSKAGGAGGAWPTIGLKQGGAVAQSHPLSCVSACGEMLGGVSQTVLVAKIGAPADAKALAGVMPGKWHGGYVGPEALPALMERGPWAAQMRGDGIDHMVVVSGKDELGNMMIRDPWGGGTTYGMTPADFSEYWSGIAVFK
ncbi:MULTISPECIES: RHS repeat-associated core domain-containing protein [unclassified Aeromicrobium]|uniref:RHS repeat-associated core domain-containing protein n=1 Tax=unclassified Aeromicrobium TaxID=2633570 RepID=UPI00396B219B